MKKTTKIVFGGGRESLKTSSSGLLVSARKLKPGVVLRFDCTSYDLFRLYMALKGRENDSRRQAAD